MKMSMCNSKLESLYLVAITLEVDGSNLGARRRRLLYARPATTSTERLLRSVGHACCVGTLGSCCGVGVLDDVVY